MIRRTAHGIELYCDECGYEIMVFTQEEVLMDESPFEAGGWSGYETAHVHACTDCWDEEIRREWRADLPCGRCNNQPCEKGRDCWWEPRSHKFPYETYIAQRKSLGYRPKDRWLWLFFEFGPKGEDSMERRGGGTILGGQFSWSINGNMMEEGIIIPPRACPDCGAELEQDPVHKLCLRCPRCPYWCGLHPPSDIDARIERSMAT